MSRFSQAHKLQQRSIAVRASVCKLWGREVAWQVKVRERCMSMFGARRQLGGIPQRYDIGQAEGSGRLLQRAYRTSPPPPKHCRGDAWGWLQR